MTWRRSARSVVIALALLGGCAHRTTPVARAATVPALPPDAVTARRLEFIERTLYAVAAVRGLPVTSRPRIELVDDDKFNTACLADHLRFGYGTQATQQECSNVFAYYDSVRDCVVLPSARIDRLDAHNSSAVLAHELEHWLVAHTLPAIPESGRDDASAASNALAEGDAQIASLAYVLSLKGLRLADYIQRALAEFSRDEEKSIDDHKYFVYSLGARFVGELFARGGFRAVDEAFRRPPKSTAEILHVDRYLAHEPLPTIATSLPLPPGFTTDYRKSMGELGLRRFLALCEPPAMAIAIAEDYMADDNTTSKPTADAHHVMGRWVILWRSEVSAMTFARTIERCRDPGVQVAQEDALSVVVMGLDASAARTYAAAVLADVRRGAGQSTRPRP